MPDKTPQGRPDYILLSKLWSIGGGIVFLTVIGWFLDQKLHTFYVLTLVGATLGIMYCFYEVWQAFKE